MGETVNYPRYQTDASVQIFDNFFKYAATVSSTEWDVINSYFLSVFKSVDAAGNFTVSLFRIAEQTGVPVMDLFQQLQGKSGPELTVVLAYYLNSLRSPCTLLGVNTPVVPNWYVSRNCKP